MTWQEFLRPYSQSGDGVCGAAFLARWGGETWAPLAADREAAGRLLTQLVSRIATQRLGYLKGVEKTALESVYALFGHTREICDAHPGCRHFEALAWEVLNVRVRPFTAKWHPQSERGRLAALDATSEFRAELSDLQKALRRFEDLLRHLRDDRLPPPRIEEAADAGGTQIAAEMQRPLPWGIPDRQGGVSAEEAARINAAERPAIEARRAHYALGPKPHAVGLALSGGGIRSATFSLGVLVALARRGLLPQFDYLSTVSGGGYLGSFLTAFLSTPPTEPAASGPAIGLRAGELPFGRQEGEAAALRHIRHHSKYLATGSVWTRVKMIAAQLYGMALNGLGIVFLAAVAVLLEQTLREMKGLDGKWPCAMLTAVVLLGAWAVAALFLVRHGRKRQWLADSGIAWGGALVAALLVWRGLGSAHAGVEALLQEKSRAMWSWGSATTALGAIPVIISACSGWVARFRAPLRKLTAGLAALSAPLFFFAIYLLLYWWVGRADQHTLGGHSFTHWQIATGVTVVLAAIYFWLLNINFTSPHRLYRNKLAEAFLIQPARAPRADRPFDEAVALKLSAVGAQSARGPYPLINGALNVPGTTNPAMQGRRTEFFLFSPAWCGSPLTGYEKSAAWEAVDPHLDLGTAMAISGAAAAPQMGLGTSRRSSFWLALLNIRLGYWVRDPRKRAGIFGGAPGLWFLLKEMLGTMNEKSPWLFVSDGGHLENLGVYELLRRRCQFIVAVDGEQDERMTFAGLTTLQRLAAIDLGVTIDLDLDDLRLNEQGYTRSHFRFGRIRYPGVAECGYLLYVKLSLTGNEGEFLRRYRLDEPAFPHHSTADQFFSETQFEAYRNLGEHVGDRLFQEALVGDLADAEAVPVEAWFRALGGNLLEPLA